MAATLATAAATTRATIRAAATAAAAALATAAKVRAPEAKAVDPKVVETKASVAAAEETLRRRALAVQESLEIADQATGSTQIRRTAAAIGDVRVSLLTQTNKSIADFLTAEDATTAVDLLKSSEQASEKKSIDDLYAEKDEDSRAEKAERQQLQASLYRTAGTGDVRSLRGLYNENAA